MSLGTEEKQKLINTHQVHPTDTGSVEVQVAMLTTRISKLSTHLQGNIHDFSSRQGLLKMIGQRKRLLGYVRNKSEKRYLQIVSLQWQWRQWHYPGEETGRVRDNNNYTPPDGRKGVGGYVTASIRSCGFSHLCKLLQCALAKSTVMAELAKSRRN